MEFEFSFKTMFIYILFIGILLGIIYFQTIQDKIIYPVDIYNKNSVYFCRDRDGIIYKITGSMLEKTSNIDIAKTLLDNKNEDVLIRVSGIQSPGNYLGYYIINIEDRQ